MEWNIVDDFNLGDFNIALNKSVDDPDYFSISVSSKEDEVWLDIDNEYSAVQIFDLLYDNCCKTHDGP